MPCRRLRSGRNLSHRGPPTERSGQAVLQHIEEVETHVEPRSPSPGREVEEIQCKADGLSRRVGGAAVRDQRVGIGSFREEVLAKLKSVYISTCGVARGCVARLTSSGVALTASGSFS